MGLKKEYKWPNNVQIIVIYEQISVCTTLLLWTAWPAIQGKKGELCPFLQGPIIEISKRMSRTVKLIYRPQFHAV